MVLKEGRMVMVATNGQNMKVSPPITLEDTLLLLSQTVQFTGSPPPT